MAKNLNTWTRLARDNEGMFEELYIHNLDVNVLYLVVTDPFGECVYDGPVEASVMTSINWKADDERTMADVILDIIWNKPTVVPFCPIWE